MAKLLLAALLSAAIFMTHEAEKPPVNNSGQKAATITQQRPASTPKVTAQEQTVKPVEQPAVAVTPPVQPESHPIGCENYRHLISQYDWNDEVMSAICHAESRGNPLAVGDNYPIGGIHAPSCGLFQVRTLASRPSCEALKDPATNIAWAYRIYQGQGYSAWSVCRAKVECS